MTRSRIIVVLLFIVAFGAGLSVAKVFHREPAANDRGPSMLSRELNLTEKQREEMFTIWDNIYKTGSDERTERRELSRKRSESIAALIPADKQEELTRINDDYNRLMQELMTQGRERYTQAVEETKSILTNDQRKKYEEILARREQQRRGRGGADRNGAERGSSDRGEPDRSSNRRPSGKPAPVTQPSQPTTQPTVQPDVQPDA